MTAYLVQNPPARAQMRPRGTTLSGVAEIHTAESAPDTVGDDGGAEAVAGFIQRRADPGSYHWLADSDSLLDLVPMRSHQAYGDGTGLNPHAVHISAATQAHKWADLPDEWVVDTVENMALAAHKASKACHAIHGVRIPARKITRDQAGRRVEGFLAHGTSDPERRTDPGADFPWELFFAMFRSFEETNGKDASKYLADVKGPLARAAEPRVTRGRQVDVTIRHTSKAIAEILKAKGKGARGEAIDASLRNLRHTRRQLRAIEPLDRG